MSAADMPTRHSPNAFDPFASRACRNIRNDLSEGLLRAIHDRNLAPVQAVAETYRSTNLKPRIRTYMEDRLQRYREILSRIPPADPADRDTLPVAALLWDHGLFFEVHEWLEKKWHSSRGAERDLYQALIRAAGTYIHLEANRTEAARKMAVKAVPALVRLRALIPSAYHLDDLIAGLEALDPVAPKLGAAGPLPFFPSRRGGP
jgi:hypothetical protein